MTLPRPKTLDDLDRYRKTTPAVIMATAAKYLRLWDPAIEVVMVERESVFTSCPDNRGWLRSHEPIVFSPSRSGAWVISARRTRRVDRQARHRVALADML